MKEFLNQSVFFGVAISVLTYELGVFLKKKLKWPICNPLLISIVAVIIFLVAFDIPYESYNAGAKYLSYLLTPATVCLAIPLLRAGGAFEKTFQGNRAWIDLRCDYESCVCACTGTVVSF